MDTEKNQSIDDNTLISAIRSAMNTRQEFKVVEELVKRIKNVNERDAHNSEPLIEIIARSASYWKLEDRMKILRALILRGVNLNVVNGKSTLIETLFRLYPSIQMLNIMKEGGADFNNSSISETNFLFVICRHGNEIGMIDAVDEQNSWQVNCLNSQGCTPLEVAIRSGNEFVAIDLIERNADVNYLNSNDESPLKIPISMGQFKVLKKLIQYGADVNYADKDQKRPLHFAVKDEKITELLLENGADVNVGDNTGQTPLSLACTNEKIGVRRSRKLGTIVDLFPVAKKLIEYGANLKYRGKKCRTLLHLTVYNEKITELLITSGLNVNAKDKSGHTALSLACASGKVEVVEKLIEHGADINYKSKKGRTLLHFAIYDAKIAKLLLTKGLDVEAKDRDGYTPLAIVCKMGKAEVVEQLIKHGADVNHKGKYDKTPLHLCMHDEKIIDLLLDNGANVNAKDTSGKTPLHLVKIAAAVKLLFNFGAHLDTRDNNACTPLYYALYGGKLSINGGERLLIIDELLRCGADIQDPKVFHFCNSRYTAMSYFIKMIAADLLDAIDYSSNYYQEQLQKLAEQCLIEVDKLKAFFVDDCTSLYKLLHKNQNRMCAYVDNVKLQDFLKDQEMEKVFPNYNAFITGCYNKAVLRKSLLQSAYKIFDKIAMMFIPDICADKIIMHLSNADMLSLIDAYEDQSFV